MTSIVNIAIIGCGGAIGPRHIQSVAKHAGFRIVSLVERRASASSIVLAKDLGATLYSSTERMLEVERNRLDAAIVCTPNDTHVAISRLLLDAGVHVLVEKPIAASIAQAQSLVDRSKHSNAKLLVGHHRRFNPYITKAKSLLDENRIGRVIAISGLWTIHKPLTYFDGIGSWRGEAGTGGPIWINLVHEIDLLQYLFGPITRVHAEEVWRQRRNTAEEGAAILLRFASGLVGSFVLCDAVVSGHSFESGTGENPSIPPSGKDFYRVFGSEGTMSVGGRITVTTNKSCGAAASWEEELQDVEVDVGTEIPFDEQIKHFWRVIREGEEPRCSGEDGLRAVIVCDAVKRALTTGLPVEL